MVSVIVDIRFAFDTVTGTVYGPPPTRNVVLDGVTMICAWPIPGDEAPASVADGAFGFGIGAFGLGTGAFGFGTGAFGFGMGGAADACGCGGGGGAGDVPPTFGDGVTTGGGTTTVPGTGVVPGGGATSVPPCAGITVPGA